MPPLPLAVTDMGDGHPVIIVHGLFGRRRNWLSIQKDLAGDFRAIAADLRNHGDSPWHDTMTYADMAADMADLVRALDGGPATVVGHSMGGKAAMVMALSAPELVNALMVIDIAPVAYAHDYAPYIDAMRGVPLHRLARRAEADEHLKEAVSDPAIRAFLLQNLEQDDTGFRWRVNLDAIEAAMPYILGFPKHDDATYEGAVAFVAGGASDYIGPAGRDAAAALFPGANFRTVDGAGHWVHAERPNEVSALIRDFVTRNAK